jgi:hypothetical protein
LLVDDEIQIIRSLTPALVAAGYTVDTAETGAIALGRAAADPYDVLILDLGLPGYGRQGRDRPHQNLVAGAHPRTLRPRHGGRKGRGARSWGGRFRQQAGRDARTARRGCAPT